MRVIFLNPAFGPDFCKSARWFARSRGRVQRHPDYLCQAIAVLEEAGHRCRLIDGAALGLSLAQTRLEVDSFGPEMVVIQGTTPSLYSDLGYARMCKEVLGADCLTVMVGPHASVETEDTLLKSQGSLDAVARREYDYTLLDLAAGLPLDSIKGLSRLEREEVVHNPDRPFIEDLDRLPFPSWGHIDPADHRDAGKLSPFITLISGRGCSGRCTFCLLPQTMYGRSYRPMSPERILAEMEFDLNLFPNLGEIMFEDDTLTLASELPRLRAICRMILQKGIKISWSANARADLTDLETLRLMKRAGCRMLCVGFEFGDQILLDRVKKGLTLERMRLFAELATGVGIRLHGCFMIGGPGETSLTARRTIDLARSLPLDTAQFSGLCPYPGTEHYAWAKRGGYLVPRDWPEWVDRNKEQRSVVNLPQLKMEEINALVDEALRSFYFRPRQVVRILWKMRSPAEIKAKIHGLRSLLDYLVGLKVRRAT